MFPLFKFLHLYIRFGEGFGDPGKWPAVPWKVESGHPLPGVWPLCCHFLLGWCVRRNCSPLVPEHIGQVPNLPPLLTVYVCTAEDSWSCLQTLRFLCQQGSRRANLCCFRISWNWHQRYMFSVHDGDNFRRKRWKDFVRETLGSNLSKHCVAPRIRRVTPIIRSDSDPNSMEWAGSIEYPITALHSYVRLDSNAI